MAVNYSNLFTLRLKAIITAITTLRTWYTDLDTIKADFDTKYVSASSQNLLGPMRDRIEASYSNAFSAIQVLAESTDLVLTDRATILNELPQLTNDSIQSVLPEIINDMIVNSQSVAASTVTIGAVTTVKTNANAGSLITSKKLSGIDNPAYYATANRKYADLDSQLSLTNDTLKITCVADSETDGTSFGAERFVVSGKPQAPSLFHWLSKGSDGATSITVAQGASIANLTFDSFTSNVPDGWSVVAGTAGVSFLSESVEIVNTGLSLEIAGNCELSLPVSPQPLGHYCLGLLVKSDGLVSGATLNVFLEGTGYTTEASTTREIVMNATALNAQTSFDLESFNVVLPAVVPDDLTIRIEVTGMSAGKIYIDFGFFTPFVYHDGIALLIAGGREAFLRDDNFTFNVTNNDAGAYQAFFRDRYGVQLPTSGSPTLAY